MAASKNLFNKEREMENNEKNDFLVDLHSPKSKLKEFDLFKELERMIERVNEGYENELEMYCLFSDAEKAFKKAKENILTAALEERDKYEDKTVKLFGKNISFTQSGRYDYTCNPEWVKTKESLASIEDLMKQSYNSMQKGVTMVDENGEIIPTPTFKSNKRSLKLG